MGFFLGFLSSKDDTKLCRTVGVEEDWEIPREDPRRMLRWSQNMQMLFNLKKCWVMHMRKNDFIWNGRYGIESQWQRNKPGSDYAKECKTFKASYHAHSAEANRTSGMIRKTMVTGDKDTLLSLCKSLVRPQLEYCMESILEPLNKNRRMWKIATQIIWATRIRANEERLKRCGPTTLERRKSSTGDLIETTKLALEGRQCNGGGSLNYHQIRQLEDININGLRNWRRGRAKCKEELQKSFEAIEIFWLEERLNMSTV